MIKEETSIYGDYASNAGGGICGVTPIISTDMEIYGNTLTVSVTNAPVGLNYRYEVLPAEGTLNNITPWVSAEQWLTVPKADSITCSAIAAYKTLSADASIVEAKGNAKGDYVTLTGYDSRAYVSATQINACQTSLA